MRLIRHTCLAALLALGGCDSTTTSDPPGPPVPKTQIALTGTPGEMRTYAASNGSLRAQCEIPLAAVASGKTGNVVRWQGGRMLWHFGLTRAVPSDTTPISEQEIVKGWGTSVIASGSTRNSHWTFYAGAPFKLTLEMDYLEEATGATGIASHTFTCGPTPPPGGVPAPVVRNVRVTPLFDDTAAVAIIPGRSLTITYEAESASGVWESGILVSGAFSARMLDRHAVTGTVGGTVRGRVEIAVPADAQIGQPIRVQAYALDGFLQPGVATSATQVQVVSNKPPVLRYAYFLTSVPSGMDSNRLVGNFAAGDTMKVRGDVMESRGPGWLVYTLGGAVSVRDSVPVPFTTGNIDVSIPVKPEWVGATRFSVQVVNGEHMYSGTASAPADSFRIVPAPEYPVRTATFATRATDMVLDEARGLLYLAFPYTGRVEVLSLATMTSTSINLGTVRHSPLAVELTRGGDTLLAALPSETAVAVVDLARPDAAPLKVPILVNGEKIHVWGVRVAANGKVLVSGVPWAKQVVEMTSSGTGQRLRADTEAAGATIVAARSADRGRIFLERVDPRCVIVYDSRTNEIGSCFPAGRHYGSWSSTPSGDRFAWGYDVFDADRGRVRSFPIVSGTSFSYTTGLSPDGSHLYVGLVRGIAKLRVSDGEYVERITLPGSVEGRILFAGPRRMIAVDARADSPDGPTTVYVVDLP